MGRCIYLRKGEVHTPPVVGIKAGDLPIGQIVKLMEGGVETEFIVVNQGIPENSSLYDASCNGTWLLRKDIKENRVWNGSSNNTYSVSSINTWLNGDYFNSLGAIEQTVIKQVKIPYVNGTGSGGSIGSGAQGLNTKIFLAGNFELGWTKADGSYHPADGAAFSYFLGTSQTDTKRIAYFNNVATKWWTRSANSNSTSTIWSTSDTGGPSSTNAVSSAGVRPALIIPSTSIFDPTTYLLKK